MKPFPPAALLFLLVPALHGQAPPGPMTITVNDADLKDVLRAATADTDLNLIFEPGLDTRVQGLSLKGTSLQEILDEVLPRLGLACTREGRNLYIHAGEDSLRFYHVDQLAMARTGSKTFQVNASGQIVQGSAGANSSAYSSSVQLTLASDPWLDLESGLMLLVFGKVQEAKAAASGSRGYSADGKSLLIQPNPGLVAVNADPAVQRRVAAFIRETQQRLQRQVLLEARIVEVTLGNDSQMGVNWNVLLGGTSGTTTTSSFQAPNTSTQAGSDQGLFQLVTTGAKVQATLSALARDNRLKVLSAPRLSTLNNQKAILRVVREEAYSLSSSQITPGTAGGAAVATGQITPLIVPVGIVLDVQPQIGDDGTITLAVNPSVTELAQERTFSEPSPQPGSPPLASTTLPVVDRRDMDTVVRVRSGETLVLAGIIRNRQSTDNRGVPWVRSIPVIGPLFSRDEKSQTRTELAIFITPTLMNDAGQVATVRQGAEKRLDDAGAPLNPPPPKPKPEMKEP
ncbi:MAG: hypothetical protein P4L36_17465 [Holophaga sp.]|nr:hypothetical protein [Holophaga sp.]